jgi:hypothetical protein
VLGDPRRNRGRDVIEALNLSRDHFRASDPRRPIGPPSVDALDLGVVPCDPRHEVG